MLHFAKIMNDVAKITVAALLVKRLSAVNSIVMIAVSCSVSRVVAFIVFV